MNGYVPTTEEIADWYAHKGGTGEFYNSRLTKRVNEFDRWLAAHDAEVRAAALSERDTEEPEWDECDYCNTFGKSLSFHERDRDKAIHWDQSYIHEDLGTA